MRGFGLSVHPYQSTMKMAAEVRWLSVVTILIAINCLNADNRHVKFEYKYSFKPPYLAQKDGSVPFWEYGGNAIASSDSVRVAPSLKSQKGAIWTKNPVNFESWSIDIMFRVTGRGRIGADGLAFWYTTAKGAYDGTVFGSSDQWNGLGLFFDSFDNDNKHNNPYIYAVVNDGTQMFDHSNDGATQLLQGCLRDFRNKPYATRARIDYYDNTLEVSINPGLTNNEKDLELCFRVENVFLPKNGYFGVSAATGGLADDHDVLHFLTSSLHKPGQISFDGRVVSGAEEAKLQKEYQDYEKKMQQEKETYRKEHPEEVSQEKDELNWFDNQNQRELLQIFEGQSSILEHVRFLSNKLDEVVGRQERTLSMLSQIQVGGGGAGGVQGATGQPIQMIDTIRRQEVDAVLANQNVILNTARELKAFIGEVNSKSETILSNQARQPTAQVQSLGYDYQSLISEMRDGLNQIKRDVSQNGKGNTPSGCPTTSCLTTTMFLVFLAVQMVILLGYNIYKDNKDAQAKKFY